MKVKTIEKLDKALTDIDNQFPEEKFLVIITSDHATPCWSQKIHSGEHVPILFKGKYVSQDKVKSFNEIDCAYGGLSLIYSKDIMPLALNFSGLSKLFNLRPSPNKGLTQPKKLTPFQLEE